MLAKTAKTVTKYALAAAFVVALAGGSSYAVDSYYDGMASRNPSDTGQTVRGTQEGAALQSGAAATYRK